MKSAVGSFVRVIFPALALIALTACGGGYSAPRPAEPPPPQTFSIGGTVSGLDAGESIVLQINDGEDLTVSANGAFTFVTRVLSRRGAYDVTIVTPPDGKACAVTGGSGEADDNVTDVSVACADPYTVGGKVSGLVGQGLELELDAEFLGIDGNGDYVFPTALAAGEIGHDVRVHLQPSSPAQRCVLQNWYFTARPSNASDISNVNVVCGEFSYMANSGADTLSTYSIDAATGALAAVGAPVATGTSPNAITGTVDKKYVYVSNNGSNDVSAFSVDASSGALTPVPGSPFAAGPNPSAASIYTATFNTSRGNHISVISYLYVANAGSDTLSAYQIDEGTGALVSLSPASYTTGAGPSAIAVRPDGQFLYVANGGGSNDISAFLIDAFSGALTPIAGSPFPSGNNVSSLVFGGLGGQFLYAANASGATATIAGFSIDSFTGDANDGALTSLSGSPYSSPACTAIVVDQTGAYLYAAAGTDLLGYRIDYQTGALSPLSGFPVAVGVEALSVSIDPSNQFLYVGNVGAGTVTGFELNGATGELTPMSGSPFAVGTAPDFIATF